jgi:LPXTG-site transpeptidase (sortase) family protein
MTWLVDFTVRLIQAGKRAYARKWSFFGVFAVAFLGSVFLLAELDLLPETLPPTASTVTLVASPLVATDMNAPASATEAEFPTSMTIPAIKLVANIENPNTTDISVLDTLLLKGAVRYPTSAKLGEAGNVILFGHSSYLPVVGNQAYKTFNGIQKLIAGDVITVYSLDRAYTYQVRNVSKESANDGAIPLSVAGRVLTLSTCDSFGKKTDRFVVVADFVESHSISS